MSQLLLNPQQLDVITKILRRHIPDRNVWAFGSRASGRHVKRFSDLDLAIDGRLEPGEWMSLVDAFDESLLPIKVDVVELGLVDADFRERIEKDFVVIQSAIATPAASSSAQPPQHSHR